MDGKLKKVAGIALVLAALSVAFLSAPALAYVNGTREGDGLKARNEKCNGDMLQTQNRERLRTQNEDCNCECIETQKRQRSQERVENKTCNCEKSLNQYRYRHQERA